MIKYHYGLVQGTPEWLQARCGLLTASEMKNVININSAGDIKEVKPSKADAEKGKDITHFYELLSQRITGHVPPTYIGDDMIRGEVDEVEARGLYTKNYAAVEEIGFMTNSKWGFTLGYSPDGLVGEDGAIECKSRKQKYQVETILGDAVPEEFQIQIQTGLLVSERKWCDFITYCAGMPMFTKRIHADAAIQDAIVAAAKAFHRRLDSALHDYTVMMASEKMRLIPTERRADGAEIRA